MLLCAALAINHDQARIYAVDAEHSRSSTIGVHHRVGREGQHARDKRRSADGAGFFAAVAAVLEDIEVLVVVGPSAVKSAFVEYLARHHQSIRRKIVGIVSVERPTEAELIALARRRFFPQALEDVALTT